jgi:capsular exopolysaccharide synthesis family protein
VFWKRKWIFLGVLAVAVVATVMYMRTLPRTYQSSTLVLMTKDQNQQASFNLGSSSRYSMQNGRSLSNEILILQQSREIAEKVANRLVEMKTHPQTGQPLSIAHAGDGRLLSADVVSRRVRGHMFANRQGEDVDALRIYGRSSVPAEAALIANLYAEEYIERTKERSRESLAASRKFLELQREQFREDVREAEDAVEQFMEEEGAVALDQESSRLVEQISQLEVRRDEQEIELDMKEERLQAELDALRDIEPRLADRLSSTLSAELKAVQKRKAELEVQYSEVVQKNPEVTPGNATARGRQLADLRQRIRDLGAKADSLASVFVEGAMEASGIPPSTEGQDAISRLYERRERVASLRIEVTGLKAQIQTVEDRLDEYRAELRSIPEQSFQLAQLQREKRLAERMYSFVQERLQETRMAEESEVGYAEVITPAGIPGAPVSPNTNRILLTGIFFGLLGGGGLVFLLEAMDTHVHQPDDLKALGFQMLGAVPSMDEMIDSDFGGASSITLDGRDVDTSLTMLVSPMSSAAETFRRIRSNLQFSRPDKDIDVIAVSSAGKGEGKTTTTANLAIAMASAGKRTLLVDTDLRRPRLHDMLDLPLQPGLSEVLFESADLDSTALDIGIDDLNVLSAGASIPNPSEVLGSRRMRDFVEQVRERYDIVLFDTPPLLIFSDCLSLSKHCDGTTLVAAAGSTDIRAFESAASMLGDVDADLIGCILNRYSADSAGYGYGYAYQYRRIEDYYEDTTSATSPTNRLTSWWNGKE